MQKQGEEVDQAKIKGLFMPVDIDLEIDTGDEGVKTPRKRDEGGLIQKEVLITPVVEQPLIQEDVKGPLLDSVIPGIVTITQEDRRKDIITTSVIDVHPSIKEPSQFIYDPKPPVMIKHFSETDSIKERKVGGRTIFAIQLIAQRVLKSQAQGEPVDVLEEILRVFPLLNKCVQRALETCPKSKEGLVKKCEEGTNGKECVFADMAAMPKCRDNERLVGNSCLENCPKGFEDYVTFCKKPSYVKRLAKRYDG